MILSLVDALEVVRGRGDPSTRREAERVVLRAAKLAAAQAATRAAHLADALEAQVITVAFESPFEARSDEQAHAWLGRAARTRLISIARKRRELALEPEAHIEAGGPGLDALDFQAVVRAWLPPALTLLLAEHPSLRTDVEAFVDAYLPGVWTATTTPAPTANARAARISRARRALARIATTGDGPAGDVAATLRDYGEDSS